MRDWVLGICGVNEMKIIMNEVPLSKNKYVNLHWSKRREYKELINWLLVGGVEEIQLEPNELSKNSYSLKKATVTFNIYFKIKRRRDIQNYLGGGLIAWLDALVDANYIADDCYDCIGQPLVTFNIDKDNPRTEIIITNVSLVN